MKSYVTFLEIKLVKESIELKNVDPNKWMSIILQKKKKRNLVYVSKHKALYLTCTQKLKKKLFSYLSE